MRFVRECMEFESDDDELDVLDDEHDEIEKWYLGVVVEPLYIPFKKLKVEVTIDGCMPSTFGNKFRFRSKDDMHRLLRVWRLPRVIVLENGSTVTDEFMMLFSIRRLATHMNLNDFALLEFGREYSFLSRVFKYFVMHTFHTFHEILIEDVMLIELFRYDRPDIIAPSNMSFVPVHSAEEQELHVRRPI